MKQNEVPTYYFADDVDDETFRAFNNVTFDMNQNNVPATPQNIEEAMQQAGYDIEVDVIDTNEYQVR